MSTATTKAVPTPISEEVLALSAAYRKEMTIDATTGVGSVPASVYAANLPATVTVEIIEDLQKYNTQAVAALTLATGESGIESMQANKTLDNVKVVMPMVGKDSMTSYFDRSRQVPDGDEGNTKSAFGTTRTSIDNYSTGSRGDFKRVKTLLSEKAAAAFDKTAK
jgi:hypothetical protein